MHDREYCLNNIVQYVRKQASTIRNEGELQRLFDKAVKRNEWLELMPPNIRDHLDTIETLQDENVKEWCDSLQKMIKELFFDENNIFNLGVICAFGFDRIKSFQAQWESPRSRPTSIEYQLCYAYLHFLKRYLSENFGEVYFEKWNEDEGEYVGGKRLKINEYFSEAIFQQSDEGKKMVSFGCEQAADLDSLGQVIGKLESTAQRYDAKSKRHEGAKFAAVNIQITISQYVADKDNSEDKRSEVHGEARKHTKKAYKEGEMGDHRKWKGYLWNIFVGVIAFGGLVVGARACCCRSRYGPGLYKTQGVQVLQEVDEAFDNFAKHGLNK